MKTTLAILSLLLTTAAPLPANAADDSVDVALVFAADVSGSMTNAELPTQRDGFVAAFRNPALQDAIQSGVHRKIAVAYVEWAGAREQWLVTPWTIISDQSTAGAFADRLAAAQMAHGSQTSMSAGLLFAASQFEHLKVQADRMAIDVSGDGANNAGPPIGIVRDIVLSRGITINGLPLGATPDATSDSEYAHMFEPPEVDLEDYFNGCVVGGVNSFALPVTGPAELFTAIQRKLALEIAALPAQVIPASYYLPDAPPTKCEANW